ncbi:hypothetical protein OH492_28545 [Vibrio chagasii]|nr:hypothetical protein [Vibrio chagasii]
MLTAGKFLKEAEIPKDWRITDIEISPVAKRTRQASKPTDNAHSISCAELKPCQKENG